MNHLFAMIGADACYSALGSGGDRRPSGDDGKLWIHTKSTKIIENPRKISFFIYVIFFQIGFLNVFGHFPDSLETFGTL